MLGRKPSDSTAERNFLVINYDQTAFTLLGTRRDMLSYQLIEFANSTNVDTSLAANENDDDSELDCTNYERLGITPESAATHRKFDAFYAFSNRSVELLPILNGNLHKKLDALHKEHESPETLNMLTKLQDLRKKEWSKGLNAKETAEKDNLIATVNQPGFVSTYTHECLADNFHTYKITNHFSDATGLKCLGVSTPEDLWLSSLSEGYETKIKPWEEKGMYKKDKPEIRIPLDVIRNEFPDNHQYRLTQIAQDAAKAYPKAKSITLTFVNDKRQQCDEALEVPTSEKFKSKWPSKVRLDVYQHHATSNHATVDFVGTKQKLQGLRQHGLFATTPHAMQTRAQKRALDNAERMDAAESLTKMRRMG